MEFLAPSIGIAVFALAFLFPWFFTILNLFFITVFSLLLGIASAIWAHIYLSSYHQTPSGLIEKIEKDLQDFREDLNVNHSMIFFFLLIIFMILYVFKSHIISYRQVR